MVVEVNYKGGEGEGDCCGGGWSRVIGGERGRLLWWWLE